MAYQGYIDYRQKILYDQISGTYGVNSAPLAFEQTTKGWALRGGTGDPVTFSSMTNLNQIGTSEYSAVYAFKYKTPAAVGDYYCWAICSDTVGPGNAGIIGVYTNSSGKIGAKEQTNLGVFNYGESVATFSDGDRVIVHLRRRSAGFEILINGVAISVFNIYSNLNHNSDSVLFFHGEDITTRKEPSASLYWGFYKEYITDELIAEQVSIFQIQTSGAITQCYYEALTSSCRRPEYVFYLRNASQGTIQLKYAPQGWKPGGATYQRNKTYKSVLRRGNSTNELQFPKEGRDFIKSAYEVEGVNCYIKFSVLRYNHATFNYESFFTGKLDCSAYKINELFVSIPIIDTSFAEKFKSRDDIKVDIYNRTSIDGMNLSAFANIETLGITLPEYNVGQLARWSGTGVDTYVGGTSSANLRFQLSSKSQLSEAYSSPKVAAGSFSKEMGILRGIDLSMSSFYLDINLSNFVVTRFSGSGSWTVYLRLRQYDQDGNSTDTAIDDVTSTNNSLVFSDNYLELVTLTDSTNYYALYVTGTQDIGTITYHASGIGSTFIRYTPRLPEIDVKCMPVAETFLRIAQIITDKAAPLTTSFFGQTDSEPTPYVSNGQLLAIINGLQIRDKSQNNYAKKTIISFKELFESLDAIFSIGVGIENEKLVVEEESYFFDSEIIIDYSSIINPSKIEKEVLPDWHWNSIVVGSDKKESNLPAGISEITSKYSYGNVINVIKKELKLITSVRLDTFGINKLRTIAENEQDTNSDYDNFIVDLYRSGTLDFKARVQEGFSSYSGDEFAATSYNMRLTPFRNIRRHYNKIKGSLLKNLGTYLRFLNTENESIFTSRFDAEESVAITSTDDILIDDLNDPIWIPEKYIVEVPWSFANQKALEANLNGIIKLDSNKYGWVLKIQTDNDNEKADMELLRVNTNVVTPV